MNISNVLHFALLSNEKFLDNRWILGCDSSIKYIPLFFSRKTDITSFEELLDLRLPNYDRQPLDEEGPSLFSQNSKETACSTSLQISLMASPGKKMAGTSKVETIKSAFSLVTSLCLRR